MHRFNLGKTDLAAIFIRTHASCAYCGIKLEFLRYSDDPPASAEAPDWTVDAFAGPEDCASSAALNDPFNLWPACPSCHHEKAGMVGWEYIELRRSLLQPVPDLWPASKLRSFPSPLPRRLEGFGSSSSKRRQG